jgi:hypothetical protein
MNRHTNSLVSSSSEVPTGGSTGSISNFDGLARRHLLLVVMFAGVVTGLQTMRFFSAPPVFSERLGRITNLQSYENNYFASLRSFTQQITRIVNSGLIPVIVLGDSTFRGTGATGNDVWTVRLQQHLSQINPALKVINLSQNAGDLVAPYLFYHWYREFPQAIFVVQWHYSNHDMVRHPFTYWLTSEIILRDGRTNPAVVSGLDRVPITSAAEWGSLIMAAMNIVAPYLDLGNSIRYWVVGNLSVSSWHNPILTPQADSAERDISVNSFTPPTDPALNKTMRDIHSALMDDLGKFVETADRSKTFFDAAYEQAYRSRLMLVVVDWNPYYGSMDRSAELINQQHWRLLRERLAAISGLNSVSLLAGLDELSVNDFVDLGHLSVPGQARIAEVVAKALATMPAVRERAAR